jgi:chitin disaccharide deacetylase
VVSSVRIVTRGDDAGSCVAANRGVEEAARFGVMRNASVMACGPAFDDAAERLRLIPGLCIGLHLTLASEWDRVTWGPLTDSPLLKDHRGVFPQSPKDLPRTPEAIAAMLAEAQAQLERMCAADLAPEYLDEHMAPTSWAVPELREPLVAWAKSQGLMTVYHIPSLPGEGSLYERLSPEPPPGTYVYVNHPAVDDDGELRTMGNADLSGEQIAAERDSDRRTWLDARVQGFGKQCLTYPQTARLSRIM